MRMTALLVILAGLAPELLGGEGAKVPAGATPILNEGSYYRYYFTRKPAAVSVESFKAAGRPETTAKICSKMGSNRQSPPPPKDWYKPEFNHRTGFYFDDWRLYGADAAGTWVGSWRASYEKRLVWESYIRDLRLGR